MSEPIRLGLVGVGRAGWGMHCPEVANKTDMFKFVAACDIIPERRDKMKERYGCKTYDDIHKLVLDPDVEIVDIATRSCDHYAHARLALEAGKDVLLEKPFTVTLDEAVEVMRAEKKSGKILSIGFQPRMDANMKMIKKIVESGALGKIYYIQTGGGRRRGIPTPFGTTFIEKETAGIGALGDIGCYSLDMVLNAIGYPKPLTVSGYKSAFFGTDPNYSHYVKIGHPEYAAKFGVDDFAAAFIRLEGDIILDFRIAWAMNLDTPGDTIIMGTKGSLRIPSTECWNGTVGGPMVLYHEVCGEQTQTEIPVIKMKEGLFDLKIRTFLDAIKEGGKAPVPSSQILYNQAIIDGIAKSSECGHEVEIKIPEI